MSTPLTPDQGTAHHFEVRTTSDSHFSWLRTRMSAERTLMSWLRTAVSMIGFGFTIVQFFEKFQQMSGVKEAARPGMPRYLGLTLIAGGTLALLISTYQYYVLVKYLWSKPFEPITWDRHTSTPTFAISIIVFGIGVFAFVSVFWRLI